MVDLPDTVVDVPEPLVDIPDTMSDLPYTMVDLPDTMVNLPYTMVDPPDTIANLPHTLVDLAEVVTDMLWQSGFPFEPKQVVGTTVDRMISTQAFPHNKCARASYSLPFNISAELARGGTANLNELILPNG